MIEFYSMASIGTINFRYPIQFFKIFSVRTANFFVRAHALPPFGKLTLRRFKNYWSYIGAKNEVIFKIYSLEIKPGKIFYLLSF